METFGLALLESFPNLPKRDCIPLDDVGYRILYGSIATSFKLELAFVPHKMIIRTLFVRVDWQRRGLGSRIVELLKDECRQGGFAGIELDTVLPESADFWRKCGFYVNGHYGYWQKT